MGREEFIVVMRLFTEVGDRRQAEELRDDVLGRIRAPDLPRRTSVERYWKIPEYFVVFIELGGGVNPVETFHGVLAALGSGWSMLTPEDAIWHSAEKGELFDATLRWAEVLLLPLAACAERLDGTAE